MVYWGRFKSYCFVATAGFLFLPATAFAEQHAPTPAAASASDLAAGSVSSSNPDYALPDYAAPKNGKPLSESSSSSAASPASFPLPKPSKKDPREDREVSLRNCR